MNSRQEVVVTGLGVVSGIGLEVSSFWESVVGGRSGIRRIENVDTSNMSISYGGDVWDFEPEHHFSIQEIKKLDPQSQYGIVAGRQALASAGIGGPDSVARPEKFGILTPTGYGPTRIIERAIDDLESRGPRFVSPNLTVYGSPDTTSAWLSTEYGARAENYSIGAACASGSIALGEAMRKIRHGYADIIVVVGAEDTLTRKDIASTANTRALASGYHDQPERASRPFDRARNGFVMSAGAAAIVVESATSAHQRGAKTLATVRGYGTTSDAHHVTAPHPEGAGAAQAIAFALEDADMGATDVDYVNAHGTGTELNDSTELRALELVLGAHAHRVPISSTKSMTGHLLGAAGVIEAVVCVLALGDGMIPPTINLDHSDFPNFDLVPHMARRQPIRTALSNSFGFGGHNATVLLGRSA